LRRVELNERADDDRRRCPCRAQTPFRRTGSGADERREGEVPVPFASDTYYHPNLPANLGLSGAQVARPRRQDPMLAMPTAGPKSTRSSCWVSSRCSSSRIRRPLARKQLEATHRARPRLKRVSHHRAQPLRICTQCIWLAFTARARAFQHRASAKFDKSIPGWAVLLLAETCLGDCKRGTGARVFGVMVRARCNT